MERNGQEIDDEKREEFYVLRLDAGLFTLQLIDYIMACLLRDGDANVCARYTPCMLCLTWSCRYIAECDSS